MVASSQAYLNVERLLMADYCPHDQQKSAIVQTSCAQTRFKGEAPARAAFGRSAAASRNSARRRR
jgi:hypothetical protein